MNETYTNAAAEADKISKNTQPQRMQELQTMQQAMYANLGISDKVYQFSKEVLDNLASRFAEIDQVTEYNQLKVIKAMQDNKVSEACLLGTTGYGYNDLGRETLEAVSYTHLRAHENSV